MGFLYVHTKRENCVDSVKFYTHASRKEVTQGKRDGKGTSRYKDQPVNDVYGNNYCLFQDLYKLPEDGGEIFLRNADGLVLNYTESNQRAYTTLCALLRKPRTQTFTIFNF
jgi:hypothetical protein